MEVIKRQGTQPLNHPLNTIDQRTLLIPLCQHAPLSHPINLSYQCNNNNSGSGVILETRVRDMIVRCIAGLLLIRGN